MRSFSAAALLTLAIVTECLSAHSDRSRQRSGPIRSVPVAADIKRDTDFDCPEEFGYYPHPTDCTLYYVCVFGGALLESCTGGLMYSHELQTCDWPRNVGCDGTSAAGGEELERISERDPPPPPPPRRTPLPPPPPPRAQPNPVVTSRGQPKFNREEYEKQQQLYAEVDDLPPVEEIESDRQQRVYRGQPSTIGQVQKDRDGYGSQVVSSRTLNSNIIPASLTQNSGKIGSFSFGTQVDDRRTATATQAPQTYSEDKSDNVTDSHQHDRQIDIETNEVGNHYVTDKPIIRRKREVVDNVGLQKSNSTVVDKVSDRSDNDEDMEYVEIEENLDEENGDENSQDDIERGKRQVRYYLKNGYKNPGKIWVNSKPIKFVDIQQFNYNPSAQTTRYQPTYNGVSGNNYADLSRKPYPSDNSYSTANPFVSYQAENIQSQRPFKPSLPDPFNQRLPHTPMNVATQIITKSPPISALKNNENPFSALAGGFYNNIPIANSGHNLQNQNYNHQYLSQAVPSRNRPNNQIQYQDSSLLPSTVVTGKPIQISTSPRMRVKYRIKPVANSNYNQSQKNYNNNTHDSGVNQKQVLDNPATNPKDEDYEEDDDEDEESSEEEQESDKDNDDHFYKHDFPEPPYEFTHPSHKYAEIENPFANPNFDFDAFIAKLRDDHNEAVGTTAKPKIKEQNVAVKIINPTVESTTASNQNSGVRSSTMNYNGMSTPRPFSVPSGPDGVTRLEKTFSTPSTPQEPEKFQKLIQLPHSNQQLFGHQQKIYNDNVYNSRIPQQNAGIPVDAVRPKLKPPNFKDERQLPITYSFNRPINSTPHPSYDKTKGETKQIFTVSQKPYVFVTSTGSPIIFSTPKQQYLVKPEKIISLHPRLIATGKPYLVSSIKPHNAYITFKQSTSKPLTTLANEQLSALQYFWKNPSTESHFYVQSTTRPTMVSDIPKLESLFAKAIKSTAQAPVKNSNVFANLAKEPATTTTQAPARRRPIPKPSPEMNDYYYDDEDEQYYYEPPVKSKYMPSTEVRPQRPPMAQNYQEYEDFGDSEESPVNHKPLRTLYRRPSANQRPETATKNHNDVSVVTKAPLKDSKKYANGRIPIPVPVDYGTPAPNVLKRPEISNYEIIHHSPRNRTFHFRKPSHSDNGPYTLRPPKYLNQTTLRPYTVRHRLAKPTTVKESTTQSEDSKQIRGRQRHPNIVAKMKLTTLRDNHNQETRYTKTKHDDKTNSLEPTESVTPPSYSASPRPKMLYNGSQNYSPDQYDPYYAVYDEDGELYKDTDYVQQYNTASLRPAVQQTYRGTPPPARRPVETYTRRPTQEDYDDALIHGQINNQNQYQPAIRHSTRGEGNELGYDHNPSSVQTTVYEATSISTTPSTTSTSTTTQRSTTAPFTEAMTPSRYTPRSSTDENPIRVPESPSKQPSDGSALSVPSTPLPMINFSSLAKPFERTENIHRLKETLTSTKRQDTSRLFPHVTNNNNNNLPVEETQSVSNQDKRKVVSLTTGFSIRRNSNNTNNPYTLTVITRPFDTYNRSQKFNAADNNNHRQVPPNKFIDDNKDSKEDSLESKEETEYNIGVKLSDSSMRRNDGSSEVVSAEELPLFVRPSRTKANSNPRIKVAPTPPTTSTTKYYLKTVIKRPAPFSASNEQLTEDSTENIINTDAIIETGLQNARNSEYVIPETNNSTSNESPKWDQSDDSQEPMNKPIVSPYRTLNNLRNSKKHELVPDYTTTTTRFTTTKPKDFRRQKTRLEEIPSTKPAYYSYSVVDEEIPDHTTEVFSGTVKNIIKAFFNNLASSPKPPPREQFSSTTFRTTPQPEEKTVNIGFQKKSLKYVDEKPLRNNVKRLQIITEPSVNIFNSPNFDKFVKTDKDIEVNKDFSSTTRTVTTTSASSNIPLIFANPDTTPFIRDTPSPFNDFNNIPTKHSFISKFNNLMTDKPEFENSRKFQKIISEEPSSERNYRDKIHYNNLENEVTKLTLSNIDTTKPTENEWNGPTNKVQSEFATTTSTTKSTTTVRVGPITSTTKSLSFPTRASRVNPAIKLAATNLGGGRRSYQSSSKCSSDDSLQANPKCNEIKYQRPSSTRGRGSAHYSTLNGSGSPQQQTSNRGTPPTRSRPTLKPSTAVVTNPNPVVDIYTTPPRRPGPVYPQPTPDKTAAKCRKDVCLLPDCYCGGKDIPGDLPVETVPQIVILTFDDSVNDLNKGLYTDLFEKDRVNPNGCPISATFYVSHEWTDYSQVQNLYAGGHEIASHTISHSFGEQFSQKKWNREIGGQREILAAYGGVKLEDVRGMRAPFLSVGGNKMFKMLYDSNFTYDSSLPVYENRPPSWPYTLDYKLFHDCMIPPCPTKSYPGVWEVPMVMWQDLNGGRCSMGDACANPPEAEGVYKMLLKNFDRHYTTNRAPFGLFYHAAWFTQPHHKAGFIMFLDFINQMSDVWIVTNWQALQWVRDPTPISRLNNFQPFQCNYQDRPRKCNNPKVCNLWHKSGVRYMRTCQPCPEIYPWTGKTGIRSSRIDNDIEE